MAAAPAAFLLIAIGIGCTKLDTTTLGADLVTVDNVNTFADTLNVNATQGILTTVQFYKREITMQLVL